MKLNNFIEVGYWFVITSHHVSPVIPGPDWSHSESYDFKFYQEDLHFDQNPVASHIWFCLLALV